MSKEIDAPETTNNVTPNRATKGNKREYEQSGLYPPGQKPFRIIALVLSLLVVIVLIAAASYLLDRVLI